MEKVSAMVVDASEPLTLNENGINEVAHIKNQKKEIVWKQEPNT